MKLQFHFSKDGDGGYLDIIREPGDPRAKSESDLLHKVKKQLNCQGFDLIKKRMWKDGHMVSDYTQYIRDRKLGTNAIALYDTQYAIRSLSEEYNKTGSTWLQLVQDYE